MSVVSTVREAARSAREKLREVGIELRNERPRYPLEDEFSMPFEKPDPLRKRTPMSYELWIDVKRLCKRGWKNPAIATHLEVSKTTVALVRSSKSLSDYRAKRRRYSKPEIYR